MADAKTAYGTSNQTITCSIASLGNGSARASGSIDNSTNKFLDALVQLQIKAPASGTSTSGFVNVYAYGSADGGSNFSDSATGSDAAITLTSPPNVRLIGVINVVANGVTYKAGPLSVAAAFGGVLPTHWGIIIENQTGGALDSTEGSHAKFYQGTFATVT